MDTPQRTPRRISKRVLMRWEALVYRARMAAALRGAGEHQALGGASNTTVPETLRSQRANINAILETADELGKQDHEVARILCEHAYTLVQNLDPYSEGRGVLQFKTGLLSVIKQNRSRTAGEKIVRSLDAVKLQEFYKKYREKNHLDKLEAEAKTSRESDSYDEDSATIEQRTELQRRVYLTARIINEAIDALTEDGQTEDLDPELKRIMEEDANKLREYKPYNILPLETPGVTNAFSSFPEVIGAARALEYKVSSSELPDFPEDFDKPQERRVDVFDFLQYTFGFQEDNAANQREHLILLLSNSQSRLGVLVDTEIKLDDGAISHVYLSMMENYERWCKFLGRESMAKRAYSMQLMIFLTALYLLIWGEAANLRFLPECLCYIFHHMADEMYDLLDKREVERSRTFIHGSSHSFLDKIVKPVHEILAAESKMCAAGNAPHSDWRNYDDFNEFFWSPSCFELSWPWRLDAGFFRKPEKKIYTDADRCLRNRDHLEEPITLEQESLPHTGEPQEKKVGKTHFVEHRTGFHIYHSFHRLWIFLVCMLQGLGIFAFCDRRLTLRNIKLIMSVGPTFILMRLIQSVMDVTLMIGAYRSTRKRNISRMLIRFVWFIVLSTVVVLLYVKTIEEENSGSGADTWFRIFYWVLGTYAVIHMVIALLLRVPWFRMQAERCSNFYVLQFIKWVHQERYYVGHNMYERTRDYFSYTLFWFIVGTCKFAFSYFLQIQPLVEPTRTIIGIRNVNYRWKDLISQSNHNALTLVALWAPVIMIYFLDTQVWYILVSALIGGFAGARMHLGEIRNLDMLRSRFFSLPGAFVTTLVPTRSVSHSQMDMSVPISAPKDLTDNAKVDAIRFAPLWNEVILSLREEDLINNREKEWLLMPDNKIRLGASGQQTLVQWPLFLLANKVYIGIDIVLENRNFFQNELWDRIKRDRYLENAVQEAFVSLQSVLLHLLNEDGRAWVDKIYEDIYNSLDTGNVLHFFDFKNLLSVLNRVTELTEILVAEPTKVEESEMQEEQLKMQDRAVRALVGLYEVVMRDFLADSELREYYEQEEKLQSAKLDGSLFSDLNWPTGLFKDQVKRLHYILTIKESALNVPVNLEARRRLQFFSNSLFMSMPQPPPVRKMFSFSALTPYYNEDVMYSKAQLEDKNVDGITILYYLQTIVPDEWKNFLERMIPGVDYNQLGLYTEANIDAIDIVQLRLWASYRGQTLARTVRGMMYYKKALLLQAQQEGASVADEEEGHDIVTDELALVSLSTPRTPRGSLVRNARSQAELKFCHVVTAQNYGKQKNSLLTADKDRAADLLRLMQMYDSLRLAYIDEVKKMVQGKEITEFYSKLVKTDLSGKEQEIYSIKLPGEVILGEEKSENQNHAIVFTRGEALQTVDMNQENYLEETLKIRNLLEEFDSKKLGFRRPRILGVREHVFTGSVSSLAWFMSLQERSFVTLGQRVLANPLKVRMHYGHSDVFDRIFHITRGGVSKASKQINLSTDIFAGFNSTLRQGNTTHHEYIQCGKGRDVGLNQIAAFEGKVAAGNGEQILSRDVFRLGQLFDFFRMLSFFFTSVGYYFTTMLAVLTIYVFLYGKVYLALSGVDAALKANSLLDNTALLAALDTQFLLQIGVFTTVPMIVNFVLEQGVMRAVISFFTMQFQMSSLFFTFSLGTRTHYFGRTILHGGTKYKSTGRGFVVEHVPFAENYRTYARSHFVKGMEIIILLIVYVVYGAHDWTAASYILLTFSSWFLALSWLFAPFVFNPSGFEWQKTVKDFEDWTNWLFHKGGIGDEGKKSWEVWWNEEQAHIHTFRGRLWEIILSSRFFLFQYGIVYALNAAGNNKTFWVYGYSWVVIVGVFLLFKIFTFSQKASANFQLIVRLFQGIVFLAVVAGVSVAVVLTELTIGDLFACSLALIPTGWGLLSIAIALRPVFKWFGLWKSVRGIARFYDATMGMILFIPIALLSWFPFVSTFQTRLVFNQAFSRGLEISVLLAGDNPNAAI
ncbi:callose synthase 9 isoform X2 [Physcomitrium patens]|uniref:callose synthase 9 isoform X2 n=1 Tax=Physcomitrium patens TaxID=3218 RepID=UPI000D1605D8|nr:callose synthase 9-like isoform X2 [Physcomitrium patens]|eukprot:XP_024363886.1 callose synthase 9-like isoform X2 [Physcomitrella patens]